MAPPRARVGEEPARAYGRRAVATSARRLIVWARRAPRGRPDEEYIHELRVRLRRARSTMRAFRRFYPSRADYERRVAPLRRLSRALGPLRDADITSALFAEVLRTVPYPPRSVTRALVAHHRAQERRWSRVRLALPAVAGLAPGSLAPAFRGGGAKGGRRVSKHARATLSRRFDDVAALESAVEAGAPADLHALRIEIKRLRYSLEAFETLVGPHGGEWGERLRLLQTTLGLVQDHTVALAITERHLARERTPLERASLELIRRILEGRRAAHIERLRVEWGSADLTSLRALIRRL